MKNNTCTLQHTFDETIRSIRATNEDGTTGIAFLGSTYGEPLPDSIRLAQPSFEDLFIMATTVEDGSRMVRMATVLSTEINQYDSCSKYTSFHESRFDMFCLTPADLAGIKHVAMCAIINAV